MHFLSGSVLYICRKVLNGGGGRGIKTDIPHNVGVARKLNVLMYMGGIKWGVRFKQGGHMSLPPKNMHTCW